MSLILSGEHLRLARDAIEAEQLYPSAHFTLLRGALVGAAQAVWVVGPAERSVRRERSLTVLTEMHTQMSKHYRRLEGFELTERERRELREQQAWLTTRREEVAVVRAGRAALNLTDQVIPEAAERVHVALDLESADSVGHKEGVHPGGDCPADVDFWDEDVGAGPKFGAHRCR